MPANSFWFTLVSMFAAVAAIGFYFTFASPNNENSRVSGSIFDYNVDDYTGATVNLGKFKGKKAYLVVNVASNCGLTSSNYEELQALYDTYSSRGLEVLAFPCNNFGAQEPGSNEEIQGFVKYSNIKFPVLGKLECQNGDLTSPLYRSIYL
jgi:glutathione peroxidase